MKKLILLPVLFICLGGLYAQKKQVANLLAGINRVVTRSEVEAPLTFLSADEMRGRDTGSKEIDIAANYIASVFKQLGLKELPGAPGYFQPVALETKFPVLGAELKFKDDALKFKDQFFILSGGNSDWKGEFVYVGYGAADEIPGDIKGKMVVSIAGSKDATGVRALLSSSEEKFNRVKEAGAAGLVEYFVTVPFPWPALVNYFGSNPRTGIKSDVTEVPHLFMKEADAAGFRELKEQKKIEGALSIQSGKVVPVPSKNVIGMIEGSDPKLKAEHIVLSAHYDHVGVDVRRGQDSIFNGARDNALGTVAVMTAAKYFSKNPPKRSMIFMALTGEEKGLLGSDWYADHPLVPLSQTVFDMDCDGAGYNDTTVVTIIGLERTSAEANIMKGAKEFGLTAIKDPVPQENLYERSDNYNFAKMGVPAIDFAPGMTAFDAEIKKYYHQPADEVSTLNFSYLVKFYRAFVYSSQLLANDPKTPFWNAGDKFESTGKALYKK